MAVDDGDGESDLEALALLDALCDAVADALADCDFDSWGDVEVETETADDRDTESEPVEVVDSESRAEVVNVARALAALLLVAHGVPLLDVLIVRDGDVVADGQSLAVADIVSLLLRDDDWVTKPFEGDASVDNVDEPVVEIERREDGDSVVVDDCE